LELEALEVVVPELLDDVLAERPEPVLVELEVAQSLLQFLHVVLGDFLVHQHVREPQGRALVVQYLKIFCSEHCEAS